MLEIKSRKYIYLVSILSVIIIALNSVIYVYGVYLTNTYNDNSVAVQSAEIKTSVSNVKLNVDKVLRVPEDNRIIMIMSTTKAGINSLSYTKGLSLYINTDQFSEMSANAYIYPDGYIIFDLRSVESAFLEQTGLKMTLRFNNSLVSKDVVSKSTYDAYDQVDIFLNAAATSLENISSNDASVESIYNSYIAGEQSTKYVDTATGDLKSLERITKSIVEYRTRAADAGITLESLPTEMSGDSLTENGLDTAYVFSGGVNFNPSDVDSFIDEHNITTAAQLTDYINSVTSEEKAGRVFKPKESLVYKYEKSSEIIDLSGTVSAEALKLINPLNDAITNYYQTKYEYQTNHLIAILTDKAARWSASSNYATPEVKTQFYY